MNQMQYLGVKFTDKVMGIIYVIEELENWKKIIHEWHMQRSCRCCGRLMWPKWAMKKVLPSNQKKTWRIFCTTINMMYSRCALKCWLSLWCPQATRFVLHLYSLENPLIRHHVQRTPCTCRKIPIFSVYCCCGWALVMLSRILLLWLTGWSMSRCIRSSSVDYHLHKNSNVFCHSKSCWI